MHRDVDGIDVEAAIDIGDGHEVNICIRDYYGLQAGITRNSRAGQPLYLIKASQIVNQQLVFTDEGVVAQMGDECRIDFKAYRIGIDSAAYIGGG